MSEDDLISKKDLLESTGISYGQLYRWKRKGLIPESWFLKKAAFTGQETFFPRAEVLLRIEKIKGLKDDVALDDLADLLSPTPSGMPLFRGELLQRNIVSPEAIRLLDQVCPPNDPLDFTTAFHAGIVESLLGDGRLGEEEILVVLKTLVADRPKDETLGRLLFVRKRAQGVCLLAHGKIVFDADTRVVYELDLNQALSDFRLTLQGRRA